MMDWPTQHLSPDVQVTVRGEVPALPPDLEARVSSIWQAAQERQRQLFNGRVFCVDTLAPDNITGYWTEYRRVMAQLRHPELFQKLRIRALAVNGLIHIPEGFVLGLRNPDAVYYGGFWQSPPAGNVESRTGEEQVDLIAQVKTELHEELGLRPAKMATTILSATEHASTHVIDVGIYMRLEASFAEIRQTFALNGNQEYVQLACVPLARIEHIVQTEGGLNLLPTTRQLLGKCLNMLSSS